MKKRRIKYGIVFLASALVSVFVYFLSAPPKSYRETVGPSTELIETKGVFKPGGYVKFTFSPEIKSLKGLYKGEVNVYPLSPDDTNKDHTIWQESGYERVGRDWGGFMSGSDKSMKMFSIKHRIDIPNSENLAGQEVVFYSSYSITYPIYAGAAPGVNTYLFKEESKDLNEQVLVKLENTTLSAEEMQWMDKRDGLFGSITSNIFVISVLVSLVALVLSFIQYLKSSKIK